MSVCVYVCQFYIESKSLVQFGYYLATLSRVFFFIYFVNSQAFCFVLREKAVQKIENRLFKRFCLNASQLIASRLVRAPVIYKSS